jgi:transcriptional regulator with XRE-family HTH domain
MDGASRSSRTPELDRLVGRNLRGIRDESGLSQAEAAEGMAAAGFPVWTKQTVADVERGTRKVSLDELAALADVTECKLERLLSPDDELSDEAERRARVLIGLEEPKTPDGLEAVTVERSADKLEDFLCRELSVSRDELAELSLELYGHPGVWVERERRVLAGDTPSVERQRQELRARRGHATRAMQLELLERLIERQKDRYAVLTEKGGSDEH